jgi:hypothetical protein
MNNLIWRKSLSQFSLTLASQAAGAWALGAKKKACLSETPVQNAIDGLSYNTIKVSISRNFKQFWEL